MMWLLDFREPVRPRDVPVDVPAPTPKPRILHDMERPQALPNLWIILQTVGWIITLDGVAEFFSERHSHAIFRRLVTLVFDRDPASPRLPDSWDEWYST